MAQPTCEIIINATPNDLPILSKLAHHIIHQCAFPFFKKTLVLDFGRRRSQYRSTDQSVFKHQFPEDHLPFSTFDETVHVNDSSHLHDNVLQRTFRSGYGRRNDHRGGPIYQYMLPIIQSEADYICHFDCDIILYSKPGFSWVAEGINILSTREEVFSVSPHSGPPCAPTEYHQPGNEVRHEATLRLVNCISSRKFLFNRSRFLSMLPMQPKFSSRRDRFMSLLSGRSALLPLESQITDLMRNSGLWRAEVSAECCWSLHCKEHSTDILRTLESIMGLVEKGLFPDAQKGYYDINLPLWAPLLKV